jgi:hypothetical protein
MAGRGKGDKGHLKASQPTTCILWRVVAGDPPPLKWSDLRQGLSDLLPFSKEGMWIDVFRFDFFDKPNLMQPVTRAGCRGRGAEDLNCLLTVRRGTIRALCGTMPKSIAARSA